MSPQRQSPPPSGFTVKLQQPDFLLFKATVSGSYAVRNHMIPYLMESLRNLSHNDCVSQALMQTAKRMREIIPGQVPEIGSTLDKKFLLGKKFRSPPE